MRNSTQTTSNGHGFSLVELMVVVGIIGILASIAIPAFQRIRESSQASRLSADFRTFSGAFELHAMETGQWAEDGSGNSLPTAVEEYLARTGWTDAPPNQGYWDWEFNRLGFIAGVSLTKGTSDMPDVFIRVDSILDDGNLVSGQFRDFGDRYVFILE